MEEIKQLEALSESIKTEIDELQSLLEHSDKFLLKAKRASFQNKLANIIGNLTGVNDSIYGVYEDLNAGDDSEELAEENEVLKELVKEKADYEEKEYIRIKHGIDLF